MNEGVCNHEALAPSDEEVYHLADALVVLGEGKAAVDLYRRKVSVGRASLPANSPTLFRLLCEYAAILESMDALAEAQFIRAEALEIVEAAKLTSQEAADAFLKDGLLLCKMHNYDGAVAKLKEAVRRAQELDGIGPLHRQIMLAQAWRGQAQAFEALGEFSQASNALDILMNVKRHIRFIVFSPAHGG
jgi:tetratricopeptide (TPR) repeat protein